MNKWDREAAFAIAFGDDFFWIDTREQATFVDVHFFA